MHLRQDTLYFRKICCNLKLIKYLTYTHLYYMVSKLQVKIPELKIELYSMNQCIYFGEI